MEQAIKLLQQQKSIEKAAEVINSALNDVSENCIPAVALPDDFSMHNLEKYLAQPARFRGRFSTSSIAEFVKYANNNADEASHTFVSDNGSSANCILDLGNPDTPDNGEHRASLELKQTAPFKALIKINGSPIGQQEWAEWIEDMRDYITLPSDPSGGTVSDLVTKVRNIKIDQKRESGSQVGDYDAARSELETIAAKSAHGELPASLVFKCAPYYELPEQAYKLRMSILPRSSEIKFKISVISLEECEEQTAKNFERELHEKLPENTNISIGSFSTTSY